MFNEERKEKYNKAKLSENLEDKFTLNKDDVENTTKYQNTSILSIKC